MAAIMIMYSLIFFHKTICLIKTIAFHWQLAIQKKNTKKKKTVHFIFLCEFVYVNARLLLVLLFIMQAHLTVTKAVF